MVFTILSICLSPLVILLVGLFIQHLLWKTTLKHIKGIHFPFVIGLFTSRYNFLKTPRTQIELAEQFATPCNTSGQTKYSGFWTVLAGHTPYLMTMDLEIVKQVYVTQAKKFGKMPFFRTSNYHYIYSSRDILTEDTNDYWRRLRNFMNPAFTDLQLKKVFETTMQEMSDRLVSVLLEKIKNENNCSFELQDFMDRFSFEVICAGGFGNDIHCLEKNFSRELQLVKDTFTSVNYRTLIPYNVMKWFKWIPFFNNIIKHCAEWRQYLQETIHERKKEQAHFKNDMLTKLISVEITDKDEIQTEDTKEVKLNNEELIACSHMILGAGEETTASTLGWVFHFLASYPIIQEKVRQEIKTVLVETNSKISFEVFEDHFEYTKAMIKEVLRLRGPVFLNARFSLEDCALQTSNGDKVFVPKGCNIVLTHDLIHVDTQLWGEDALEFKPERFLQSQIHIDNYKFCPFGVGQRSCIGKRFAELEMVSCIAKMITQFQFEFPENYHTSTLELPEVVVFTTCIGKCHVKLVPLQNPPININ